MPRLANSAPAIVTATRTVDAHSLARRAKTIQAGLASSIRPGAPLGIWVQDEVDFAACVIAAMAVSAQAFLAPPDAPPTRIAELCAIEGGAAVLCDEERAVTLVEGASRRCAPGLVLVGTQPQPAPSDHDQGAVHFFTSGTEGRPKGVARSKRSLEREELIVGGHLGMASGRAVLCSVPVTHGYGFTAGLFAPLSSAALRSWRGPGWLPPSRSCY